MPSLHGAGICDCCTAPACPACGETNVSANLPGHILDLDPPNPPMICEECKHEWDDDDL